MATSTRILAYKAKRKLLGMIGALGFWGGALLLLLDMTTSFPTPARGAYAMWWLLVVALAVVFWVLSRKLPNLELIDLADEYKGELTISLVMQEMSLPVSMATAALEAMSSDDLAGEIQLGKQRVWVFYNMDDDNRLLVKTMQQARAHGGRFTVPVLAQVLGVSLVKARTVLARAEDECYAQRQEPEEDARAEQGAESPQEVWIISLGKMPPVPEDQGSKNPRDAGYSDSWN